MSDFRSKLVYGSEVFIKKIINNEEILYLARVVTILPNGDLTVRSKLIGKYTFKYSNNKIYVYDYNKKVEFASLEEINEENMKKYNSELIKKDTLLKIAKIKRMVDNLPLKKLHAKEKMSMFEYLTEFEICIKKYKSNLIESKIEDKELSIKNKIAKIKELVDNIDYKNLDIGERFEFYKYLLNVERKISCFTKIRRFNIW